MHLRESKRCFTYFLLKEIAFEPFSKRTRSFPLHRKIYFLRRFHTLSTIFSIALTFKESGFVGRRCGYVQK